MNKTYKFLSVDVLIKFAVVFISVIFMSIGIGNVVRAEGGTDTVVTADTFYDFFDEHGLIKDSVTASELTFKGDFDGPSLQIGVIYLDRSVTIKSDKAKLTDIGFCIDSEDVTLDGLTLVATKFTGDLIYVRASNVTITNMDISYTTGDVAANVINVAGDDTLSYITISKNKIVFDSDKTDDEELVTAINLQDAESSVVEGNNITVSLNALYPETYDWTYFMPGLCYVSPVRFYEVSLSGFIGNTLDVTLKRSDEFSYPNGQAIYIVGSDALVIGGNTISVSDYNAKTGSVFYYYGVVCGFSTVISFEENNIDVYASGGKPDMSSVVGLYLPTTEALVTDNTIRCSSLGSTIGIQSPYGFGPAKYLTMTGNTIDVEGYSDDSGSYSCTVGIEVETGYAKILENKIKVINTNEDYGDSFRVTGVGAVMYSVTELAFDVHKNVINTNGKYSVDIRFPVQESQITGNNLTAHDLTGDDSVFVKEGSSSVTIEDNNPSIIGVQPGDLRLTYGYTEYNNLKVGIADAAAALYNKIEYQWYECKDSSGANPELLEGATEANLPIMEGEQAGYTGYFFCHVTATNTESGIEIKQDTEISTVTVVRKDATVCASDMTKAEGDEDPELEAVCYGLVGDDKLVYTLSREPGEDVGIYIITASGESEQGNYNVYYQTGMFTINEKVEPTPIATVTPEPSGAAEPTAVATATPTVVPGEPTAAPSAVPTTVPTTTPAAEPTAQPAEVNLTLDKDKLSIVCGKTGSLKATLTGSTGAIAWTTSDKKIATVDASGKIVTKQAGTVTITATAEGKSASCVVTVLYKDVTKTSEFWYAPTNYLTAGGVVKGYDNQTKFKPANDCTRAQMVTFLWRLAGEPAPKSTSTNFKDVKKSAYYFKPVLWAVEKGITTGVSKTKFNPSGVCTRAQTVTFLWRMAGKPSVKNAKNPFQDVKQKDYFYKAVLWASDKKIVAGYSDGTFKPQGKCLRRQMVTFLYKYDKNINGKG